MNLKIQSLSQMRKDFTDVYAVTDEKIMKKQFNKFRRKRKSD